VYLKLVKSFVKQYWWWFALYLLLFPYIGFRHDEWQRPQIIFGGTTTILFIAKVISFHILFYKKKGSRPWSKLRRLEYNLQSIWRHKWHFMGIALITSAVALKYESYYVPVALSFGLVFTILTQSVEHCYTLRKAFERQILDVLEEQTAHGYRMPESALWICVSTAVDVRRKELFHDALRDLLSSKHIVDYQSFGREVEYECNIDEALDYAFQH
jgi:tryptophan-rich sensory protein